MPTVNSGAVTEQLAEWVVSSTLESVPPVAVERVKERVLDSLGVQFAGMAVSTGRIMADWVRDLDARQESTVIAAGFQTTAAFATLVNATAGHALEFDDIATFSGHYANPLTAAALAVGEQVGASGRDVILGWLVGYEVIAQTPRPCAHPKGNSLLARGWFNQGFQPVLGVAALTAKLRGLDPWQTRMAVGNAAAAMGGMMKNRGSDTKSFTAGNAAMHGVIAAELAGRGFTANEDILDGEIGLARLLNPDGGDAESILEGLGDWHMATQGSSLRLHASCAAGHWGVDALAQVLREHPATPDEIESIEVALNEFLLESKPYRSPETGLQAKYSVEYDIAALALDGRLGLAQFTDESVQRPEVREMMRRVNIVPVPGDLRTTPLESRVVVTFTDGAVNEATVQKSHGSTADPLTPGEVLAKFHECAEALVSEPRRDQLVELCSTMDSLPDIRLTRAIGASE